MTVVLAAKWGWIERFGGEVPYMDQWDAEALAVYGPMLRGELAWGDFFLPHNEHRIVTARAWAAALFLLGDQQWDPRVQMIANAVLHALFLALAGAWFARRVSPRGHPALFGLLFALGASPFAYENLLWGFQSPIYFVLLFGWLGGIGLLSCRPPSPAWVAAFVAGVLAVLSFGSGVLVGIAVCGVTVLKARASGRWRLDDGWRMAAGVALVILSGYIRTDVPGHDVLHAESWAEFSLAAWRLVAWPGVAGTLGGVVLWAPSVVLCARFLMGRQRSSRLAIGAAFLSIFAAGQVGALSAYRALDVLFSTASSRYLDLLSIVLLSGLIALFVQFRAGRCNPRWTRSVTVGWLALALLGLGREGWSAVFGRMEVWREDASAQRDTLRTFLQTDDMAAFANRSAQQVGYPDAERLAAILRQPGLKAAMPPALQIDAVELEFAPESGFRRGGIPGTASAPSGIEVWGNANAHGLPSSRLAVSNPVSLKRGNAELLLAVSSGAGVVYIEGHSLSGRPGFQIRVMGARTGGETWSQFRLRLEPGDYVLRVRDEREAGWVALSAPREMSGLGMIARDLSGLSWHLFSLGMVGLGLSLAGPAYAGQRHVVG